MNVNQTLISTALLTAIFDKTKKSNIELISPFILFIISELNGEADDDTIKKRMESDFSFFNFPHAVLNILINKLKKDGMILQTEKKYSLLSKAQKIVEDFKSRKTSAEKESKEFLEALMKYLQDNTIIKVNYNGVKTALASFLDKNGYIIYSNFNPVNLNIKNKDRIQFFIGKFIEDEYAKDSKVFKNLLNIVEGMLLSNVIYLQMNIDNRTKLDMLNCYFDTPFLLRLIEFKTVEDNVSAKELVELLRSQGAKIKCFRHSFEEVQSILRNYIDSRKNGLKGKTLEALDLEDYSDIELNEIYLNLESTFKQLNIIIEEKPDYEKEVYKKGKYEDVIDEKRLKEILLDRYTDKNIVDKVIDNDIDSVSAIMRLRNGKRIQKLEDCKYIFITSNYDIRTSVRQLLNIDERLEISPVIGDVDLTAIIWLRTLNDNPNLPKDILIQNARAAMKPSPEIIEKFNQSLEKIKKTKYVKDGSSLQALIYTTHFSSRLMDEIEGDVSKVNPSTIVKLYEDSLKDAKMVKEENKVEKTKNKKLKAENDELAKKLIESMQEKDRLLRGINKKYDDKIQKYSNFFCILSKVIVYILLFMILCTSIYFTIFGFTNKSNKMYLLLYGAFVLISLYSLLGSFVELPYFFSIPKVVSKYVYTKITPIISKKVRKKQKIELDDYFNNIDKGGYEK